MDLDVTDDLVHGNQEQVFFNTYYGGYCYAPLYIFCGKHLLAAKLRPSNVDPAAGALSELQRVIKQIGKKWKNVEILVRGDSAYARENINDTLGLVLSKSCFGMLNFMNRAFSFQ